MLDKFTAEHAESAENYFININHREYGAHREKLFAKKIKK